MPLRELKQLGYFTFFRAGFPIYSAAMVRALALSSNYKSVRYRLGWIHAWQFVLLFSFVLGCSVPSAKVRAPSPDIGLSQIGIASWYGPGFHGKATASGIIYDQNEFTAAHQTLPLGTRVLVTNMENGRTTEVIINDRGPFAKERIIDLSHAAAQALGIIGPGTALVRIDVIENPARIRAIRGSLDYTLQLGSFAQLENARQLRDRLGESFGEVTISPVNGKDNTYYRVHLGNFSSRADAEQRAKQISQAGYSVIIMEK
ncbi:MAG: septal ring lytic transglycosylase RlpA family protein [Candidatus Binatia bacterium]